MFLKIKSITKKKGNQNLTIILKKRLLKTRTKRILTKLVCIVMGLAFQLGHCIMVSIWKSYLISEIYPNNVMILRNTWGHICLYFISILPIRI